MPVSFLIRAVLLAAAAFLSVPAWAQALDPGMPGNGPPQVGLPQPGGGNLPPFWAGEDGRSVGPLDRAEIERHAADGRLTRDTLVWTNGMSAWQPASSVPAIAAIVEASAQGGPPPLPGTPPPLPQAGAPVAPPSGQVAAANVDPARFMVGDWMLESRDTMDGVGPVTIRLNASYAPNGQARAQGTMQAQGQAPLPVVLGGNWRATPAGQGRFRFEFQGSMMISPGPGQQPVSQPVSETSMVSIVDPDTIRTDTGVVQRRVRR